MTCHDFLIDIILTKTLINSEKKMSRLNECVVVLSLWFPSVIDSVQIRRVDSLLDEQVDLTSY